MADYQIGVDVKVEDSQLDSLENKIRSLQNMPNIKLGVDVEQGNLKRSIESVLTKVNKDYKKKYKGSLTESIVGTADSVRTSAEGYETLGKALKNIDSFTNKDINLKINVPDGVLTELERLHTKLKEIKSTAESMGSIKLKVSDVLPLKNGQIEVGSVSTKDVIRTQEQSVKKIISGIKEGARVESDLRRQIQSSSDSIYKNELEQRIKLIQKEREESFDKLNKLDSVSDTTRISTEEYVKAKTSVDDYTKSIDRLRQKKAEFDNNLSLYGTKNTPPIDKALNIGYKERLNQYEAVLKQIETLNKDMSSLTGNKLANAKSEMNAYIAEADRHAKYLSNPSQFAEQRDTHFSKSRYIGIDSSSEHIYNSMDKMATELAKGSKYTTSYNEATKRMTTTIERGNGLTEKYQIKYNQASGMEEASISGVNKHTKPLSSYFSELGTKFKSLSQYLVSNFGFEALQYGIASGIESIKELDSAMTELKKTSNGTKEEYRSFTKQANVDAKNIGSTTAQITNSAADWSRLGYSLSDSSILAKNTGILKNVSEFETIEEATSAMTSMMKAYDVKAEGSMELIDKMNLVGNNYAISTDGIATALQNSGSALIAAGNDFDKSVAMVTAGNSVIQDPSQVGKTLPRYIAICI